MALTLNEQLLEKYKQDCITQAKQVNIIYDMDPVKDRQLHFIQCASKIGLGYISALMVVNADINLYEFNDELTKILTQVCEQEIK